MHEVPNPDQQPPQPQEAMSVTPEAEAASEERIPGIGYDLDPDERLALAAEFPDLFGRNRVVAAPARQPREREPMQIGSGRVVTNWGSEPGRVTATAAAAIQASFGGPGPQERHD